MGYSSTQTNEKSQSPWELHSKIAKLIIKSENIVHSMLVNTMEEIGL